MYTERMILLEINLKIKKTLVNGNQRWRWGAWRKIYKFQYRITVL